MANDRNARVLLVDDNPSMLEALSQFLASWGFLDFAMAGSGEEAVAILRKLTKVSDRFDAIILDWILPPATAAPWVPIIRGLAPFSGIVIISGYEGTDYYIGAALAAGADAFVPKNRMVLDLRPAIIETSQFRSRQIPQAIHT